MVAEGYSSPLWVLLLWLLGAMGMAGFGAAKVAGTLVGAATSAAIGFFATRRLGWKRGLAISLVLALSPGWAWWSASGMETPLLGLLFAITAMAILSNHTSAAALATGLIGIVRPEGFVYVAIILGYFLMRSARDRWPAGRTTFVAVLCLLPLVSWTVFRFITYDAFIANAAWAKLGAGPTRVGKPVLRGIAYIVDGLWRLPGPWLIASVSTVAILRRSTRDPGQILIMAMIYLLVLFSLFVGGDWMPWVRFLVPGIPLMLILGLATWNQYPADARPVFGAVVAVALLLTCAQQYGEFHGKFTHHEVSGHNLVARWPVSRRPLLDPVKADIGAHFYAKHLARFTKPNDVVVHLDIGQSGYLASDVSLMDTFGLVSRFEAAYLNGRHSEAQLKQRFAELDPSVVFLLVDPNSGRPMMNVMQPLAETVSSQYEEVAKAQWWGGNVLFVMVRKDRLASEVDPQRMELWRVQSPGLVFDPQVLASGI